MTTGTGGNTSPADIGLDDIEADINSGNHGRTPAIGGVNYRHTILKIEVCVCKNTAAKIRKYWDDLYTQIASSNPPTYGVPGLHCTSTVCQSVFGGKLTWYTHESPAKFAINAMEKIEHNCGSNKGELVDFDIYQQEDVIP